MHSLRRFKESFMVVLLDKKTEIQENLQKVIKLH